MEERRMKTKTAFLKKKERRKEEKKEKNQKRGERSREDFTLNPIAGKGERAEKEE
jgi:hypothetical protein